MVNKPGGEAVGNSYWSTALLRLFQEKRIDYQQHNSVHWSQKKQKQKVNGTGNGMLFCYMRNWLEYL